MPTEIAGGRETGDLAPIPGGGVEAKDFTVRDEGIEHARIVGLDGERDPALTPRPGTRFRPAPKRRHRSTNRLARTRTPHKTWSRRRCARRRRWSPMASRAQAASSVPMEAAGTVGLAPEEFLPGGGDDAVRIRGSTASA